MSKEHYIRYVNLMDSKHTKYSYMKDGNAKAAEIGVRKPYAVCNGSEMKKENLNFGR